MAQELLLINLKDCKLLKKLPENICRLKVLEKLIVSGCSNLSMFPAEMRKMESLKVFLADGLDFSNSNYQTQQNESWRGYIWDLVLKPKISSQLSLTSLPCNSIKKLSLVNCNLRDSSFPKDFGVAPSLEYLNLSNNPISFLPDCFKCLKEVKILYLHDCNQLKILEDLPAIKYLEAIRCPLLEKITPKPGLYFKSFHFPYKCEKLLEMKTIFKIVPIEEIDSKLINDCGIYDVEYMKTIEIRLHNTYTKAEMKCTIQGINDYGFGGNLFSIFYPGSSIPTLFTSQSYVPSLSLIVSHSNVRYLNTCVVYKLKPGEERCIYIIFHNMTKDKFVVYHPCCYGIPEDDEYMTWLSHWKFGSHEVGPGDEVNISVFNNGDGHSFEVKQIGVYLVYEEQEHACEEISQYVIPVERQPTAYYGMMQLYFIGHGFKDSWVEKHFGKYARSQFLTGRAPWSPEETDEPLTLERLIQSGLRSIKKWRL